MAQRANHYEAAFEAYLRASLLPYVAVDEKRRSLVEEGSLKSLDFIVSPPGGFSWLVDVKGRRFPSGDASPQYWRNWSTRDDLYSLDQWQRHFGAQFGGLLVFAYHLVGDRSPVAPSDIFRFRDEAYAFVGIRLAEYAPRARPLSRQWDTVTMTTPEFRRYARPVEEFFRSPENASPSAVPSWHGPALELEW